MLRFKPVKLLLRVVFRRVHARYGFRLNGMRGLGYSLVKLLLIKLYHWVVFRHAHDRSMLTAHKARFLAKFTRGIIAVLSHCDVPNWLLFYFLLNLLSARLLGEKAAIWEGALRRAQAIIVFAKGKLP